MQRMREIIALVIAVVALLGSVISQATPLTESGLLNAINDDREAVGLIRLLPDASLDSVAQQRADAMAASGYFSHHAPEGHIAAWPLLDAVGVYGDASEIIARNNHPNPVSEAVRAWMQDSADHRAAILEDDWSRAGTGVALGADGLTYLVVIFAL